MHDEDIDYTFDERESEMYDEADGPKRRVRHRVPAEWTES